MNLIERIMTAKEVAEQPPVLLDIGASEGVHPPWRPIAKYCICIAFDPDAREFSDNRLRRHFRQFHSFDCVVSADPKEQVEFYLTRSPYCSSRLEPDTQKLKEWAFSPLFAVERKITLKAKTLPMILQEIGLQGVDWFKVDSQGTDLRLFKSLGNEIYERILAAEFEPGIIDAYKGEDKLYEVFKFIETTGFWLSGMRIKGSQRISSSVLESLFPNSRLRKMALFSQKTSPGWAELFYLNSFQNSKLFSKREYLLGWLFATLQNQDGFAYQVAQKAQAQWADSLFHDMESHSRKKIRSNIISFKLLPVIAHKIHQIYDRIFKL
jgi:FkbM family methyltransferase